MGTVDLNAMVYEAEVTHRIEHVTRYLRDVKAGRPASVLLPLWSLRALQDESAAAGHPEISELCRQMEVGIITMPMGARGTDEQRLAELAHLGDRIKENVRRLAHGEEECHNAEAVAGKV